MIHLEVCHGYLHIAHMHMLGWSIVSSQRGVCLWNRSLLGAFAMSMGLFGRINGVELGGGGEVHMVSLSLGLLGLGGRMHGVVACGSNCLADAMVDS